MALQGGEVMTEGISIAVDGGPLSDGERAELEAFLDQRIVSRGGLSIEYVDGLFAGLLTMPGMVPPGGWLEMVLGEDEEGPAFESQEEMARILSLLMRHYNAVARGIRGGGTYAPIVRQSPNPAEGPPGRAWARSFMAAGEMAGGRAWRKLLDDPVRSVLAAPIIQLAMNGEMEGKRRKPKLLTDEERRQLIAMIVDLVLPTLRIGLTPAPRGGSRKLGKNAPRTRRAHAGRI
jgi:yecA family protein